MSAHYSVNENKLKEILTSVVKAIGSIDYNVSRLSTCKCAVYPEAFQSFIILTVIGTLLIATLFFFIGRGSKSPETRTAKEAELRYLSSKENEALCDYSDDEIDEVRKEVMEEDIKYSKGQKVQVRRIFIKLDTGEDESDSDDSDSDYLRED